MSKIEHHHLSVSHSHTHTLYLSRYSSICHCLLDLHSSNATLIILVLNIIMRFSRLFSMVVAVLAVTSSTAAAPSKYPEFESGLKPRAILQPACGPVGPITTQDILPFLWPRITILPVSRSRIIHARISRMLTQNFLTIAANVSVQCGRNLDSRFVGSSY